MNWNQRLRHYEDENGQALTPTEVRKHIEEFITSEKLQVRQEADALFAQQITVAEFFAFMRQRVTAWHSVAGQIAYGGQEQMNQERWKRVNEKILSELEYLSDFEQQVEQSFLAAELLAERAVSSLPPELGPSVVGSVADALLQAAPSEAESVARAAIQETLGDSVTPEMLAAVSFAGIIGVGLLIGGTIETRAEMYTDSTYATYENAVLARETDEGVTLGRRVLEEGDNCDDCIAAATEEFVPLADLPEIGDSQCQSRCRCEFEFLSEGESFRTSELFSGRIAGQEAFGGDVEIN